jgi:hypothetical protein
METTGREPLVVSQRILAVTGLYRLRLSNNKKTEGTDMRDESLR